MIGRTLSHFRIIDRIGEGGMGIVYRAEDTRLQRHVALKVLPPDLTANEERRLRFLREALARPEFAGVLAAAKRRYESFRSHVAASPGR